MTTIVNPPPVNNNSNGSMGLIFGLVALIIVGYLFFMFALPVLQNVKLGNPQITIPAKINVTVEQPK